MFKLLTAVLANRKILVQIMKDDLALAHVELDPENARSVADQLKNLADLAEGIAAPLKAPGR